MISLRAIPMVRLVIPLICGIYAAAVQPALFGAWVSFALFGFLFFLFLILRKTPTPGRANLSFGMGLFALLFFAGVWLFRNSDNRLQNDYFGNKTQSPTEFIATVSEPPKEGKWWKIQVALQAAKSDSADWEIASGNVLIMLDSAILPTEPIRYGSKIWVKESPQALEAPKNPYQFDYKNYLNHKNIHYQVFLKNEPPAVLAQGEGNWAWQNIYAYRKNLLEKLKTHLTSEGTFPVGAAILLGYKDELSDELRATFVETGTMHILAVSGAHVGILYGCLAFLFGLIPFYGRRWQIAEPLLLMACIWFFVLLTGAAEPAVRAAIMFSFYSMAKMLRKDRNVYNILGLSAFIMLLYEPRQLFTIGFQLSFGAVLGIALFWQHFRKLIPWNIHKNWHRVLDVVAVGCAAQLGILPFSLYYFHQLPTFFWLTGTLVMPFATLYLWGSIALLSVGTAIPFLGNVIGSVLDKWLWLMNGMLIFFKNLPGHLIEGIWITPWMFFLLFVALYAFAYALFSKKKQAVWLAGISLCLVAVGNINHWWQHHSQEKITAYSMGKNLVVDGFSGTVCLEMQKGLDEQQVLFAAKNNRAAHAIRQILPIAEQVQKNKDWFFQTPILAIGKKRIAILDKPWKTRNGYFLKEKIKVNALYLRKGTATDLENMLSIFDSGQIIVDGSLTYKLRKKIHAQTSNLGLAFCDLSKDGAWETPP